MVSQENVDQARAGVAAIDEAFRLGDIGPWAAHVHDAFEPDVVLATSATAFTEGEWRGHAGAVGFIANPMEVLDRMWIRADEVIDVDDELLVVLTTFGGHARHTGIDLENTLASVFEMREGKVRAWRMFESRDEALEAIGQRR